MSEDFIKEQMFVHKFRNLIEKHVTYNVPKLTLGYD